MPNSINYRRELEMRVQAWSEMQLVPRILLHSCCAPCSSACLEYLTQYARVTVFYYNPNITSQEEYTYRLEEQKRLIGLMPFKYPVDLIEGAYEPECFLKMSCGLEDAPERGPRCRKCYALRLEETARMAREGSFDYFATTLTLSPLKPAEVINAIGLALAPGAQERKDIQGFVPEARKYKQLPGSETEMQGPEDIPGFTSGAALYLPTDFKKNNGYKRSIELSKEYGLYRQNYCGCVYSKRAREAQEQAGRAQEQAGGAQEQACTE